MNYPHKQGKMRQSVRNGGEKQQGGMSEEEDAGERRREEWWLAWVPNDFSPKVTHAYMVCGLNVLIPI